VIDATAIVPMYNEAETCAPVLRALLASGRFSRVLAVDDGSKDGCSKVAAATGAEVLVLSPNRGKGQAMLRALHHVDTPWVGFFDADLYGFRPHHVDRFFDGAEAGYDMICGFRDRGRWITPLECLAPIITGERLMRSDFVAAIPPSCWDGYKIETGMNATVDRLGGRTLLFVMDGVIMRRKEAKVGFWRGMMGELKMWKSIREAKDKLRCTGGNAC
jgi:glycosyltransferase involved in cell wall biosynthesis